MSKLGVFALLVCSALVYSGVQARATTAVCTYPGGNCYNLALQYFKGCGINDGKPTIHGLWPEWASNCTNERFDKNKISSLEEDLRLYWPTCTGTMTFDEFHAHEWQTHGSCSGMDQLTYFQTALEMGKDWRERCTVRNSKCNICFDRNLDSEMQCD
eukprot:Colp12_sorted_trinity150504_noHs@13426